MADFRLDANWTTVIAEMTACVLALVALFWLRSTSLAFAPFGPTDVVKLLTPVILTAAFVERAVEVVISPWRDPEANKRLATLAAAKATSTADPAGAAQRLQNVTTAATELSSYRGQTERYAFVISFTISLVASLAGIRALSPFLKSDALTGLGAQQHALFMGFDVLLTAALLAGGADGLHSVVTAFTSFFDATSQRATNAS
jgi:hypothetical protein